jgi:hypothetical protein
LPVYRMRDFVFKYISPTSPWSDNLNPFYLKY